MSLALRMSVLIGFFLLGHHTADAQKDRYKEFRTSIGQCLLNHAENGTLDAVLSSETAVAAGEKEDPKKEGQ